VPPWTPPSEKNLYPKQALYHSNCVFNLYFLALVVSEIFGGSQIYISEPCAPSTPPSGEILTHTQIRAYTYITVKFQLRSSINMRLTENSLYNRFCIERSPKWSFGGFWGQER